MPFEYFETLEDRRLFSYESWGAAERLIRLPDALDAFQSVHSLTGAGQTVAVIDSGIDYTHPALGGGFGAGHRVVGGYDFVDNDNDPIDTFGHGTEVAGLIAASPYVAGGLTHQGIAPAANMVALRVDDDGTTSVPDSRIQAALQWCIDHRTEFGITVVNISYGTGDYPTNVVSSIYGNQIQQLTDSGVIIVASAGNGGLQTDGGINTPAADPNVISVGSVDTFDVISPFSRRGKVLDLLAPGDGVSTTVLLPQGTFGDVQGTSFAAPVVAGTVALMKSFDPALTQVDALSILRASGKRNFDGDTETAPVTRLNYSRLDLLGALRLTDARTPADPALQALVGKNGNGNAMAVDAQGVTHYVYYDSAARTMKYATRDTAGQWSATQTIDTSRDYQGYYVSMAVDPLGQPAIAYFDGTNGDLKFARYDGVSWNVKLVDAKNSVGLYPSLAFDRNGLGVISYYRKTTGDLKVARENLDGTFAVESVDRRGDVGRSTSVAIDANGRIGIAYEDTSHEYLKYALRTAKSPTWGTTVVDSKTFGGASFISTAFNPGDNNPWISYYDAGPADLKVANFSSRAWVVSKVDTAGATGLFTTMFFAADQLPRVLYWDKSDDTLVLAKFDGTWMKQVLKSNAGRFAAGTIDPTLEVLRYSYYDAANSTLKVDGDVP